MKKNRILSICIPTYNRSEVLLRSVQNILKSNDSRFEIIVCDDSNNDLTTKTLQTIKDERLIINKNKNQLRFTNVTYCLTQASGEYCILILDKDSININYLPNFINILENNNIALGYVKLSSKKLGTIQKFSPGYPSILNMAYLSKHCSGYFYKTSLYQQSETVKNIISSNDKFPFPFELINSEISQLGPAITVDLPLLILEKPKDSAKTPSGNFTGKNIYFMPPNRMIEFKRYCSNLQQINKLSKTQKAPILQKFFYQYLFSVTTGLKYTLLDPTICNHSKIPCYKMSIFELFKQSNIASKCYFSSTSWIGYSRYFIYLKCIIRNICSILKASL